MPGQPHDERRARFGGGHDADLSLMGKHNFLCDVQPEAEARSPTRRPIAMLPAREGLENDLDLAGRYRVTVIMHGNEHVIFLTGDGDMNHTVFGAVLKSIADEIRKHLPDVRNPAQVGHPF